MKFEIDIDKVFELGVKLAHTMQEISAEREQIREGKHRRKMDVRKLRNELKLKRMELKAQTKKLKGGNK